VYLLDTNILSHVIRRRPPMRLVENLRQHAQDSLFTSCVCVMELRHGAMRRADRGAPWSRIEREVLARVEIIGLGLEEAIIAGDTMAQLDRRDCIGPEPHGGHEQRGSLPSHPRIANPGLDHVGPQFSP
jgi:predicted nucleic acid-binding protein